MEVVLGREPDGVDFGKKYTGSQMDFPQIMIFFYFCTSDFTFSALIFISTDIGVCVWRGGAQLGYGRGPHNLPWEESASLRVSAKGQIRPRMSTKWPHGHGHGHAGPSELNL